MRLGAADRPTDRPALNLESGSKAASYPGWVVLFLPLSLPPSVKKKECVSGSPLTRVLRARETEKVNYER